LYRYITYIVFLYFQLVSHKEYFEEEEDDDDEEDDEAELGFWEAIYYMAGITVFISLLSDYIVDTIEGAAKVRAVQVELNPVNP
jgi:Ca2+:H+ antiporter